MSCNIIRLLDDGELLINGVLYQKGNTLVPVQVCVHEAVKCPEYKNAVLSPWCNSEKLKMESEKNQN